MTLLGSQQTALGSVPTAAEGVPGGGGPSTGDPIVVGKFSGTLVQEPTGTSETYLSDVGELAPTPFINDGVPQNYPTSARTIEGLRVTSKSGTGGKALVVTLYKNAAPTAMTVTVPAGSAPGQQEADFAHAVTFADGDTYDLHASMTSGVGDGPYFLSATLEGPPGSGGGGGGGAVDSDVSGLSFPVVADTPTLTATNPVTLPGLELTHDLVVSGAATLHGTLEADGAATFNGALDANNGIAVQGGANVQGGIEVVTGAIVADAGVPVTLHSTLEVDGTATMNGALDANNGIAVQGGANVQGGLEVVTGAIVADAGVPVTLHSTLEVDGAATLNGGGTLQGNPIAAQLVADTVNTSGVELSAIDASVLTVGATAWINSVGAYFQLRISALTVDHITVETASGRAGGQWVRMNWRNPIWEAQAAWFVNTSTGSDEAAGTVGAPLKTLSECARRLSYAQLSATTCTLTGNTASTDTPTWTFSGGSFCFTLACNMATLFSGSVTTAVNSSAAPTTTENDLTDTSIPTSFTASGLMANGVAFQFTSGLANRWFWAAKDVGGKTARISKPHVAFAGDATFANGDTYTAGQCPTVHQMRFTGLLSAYAVFVQRALFPAGTVIDEQSLYFQDCWFTTCSVAPNAFENCAFQGACFSDGAGANSAGGPIWNGGMWRGTGATAFTVYGGSNCQANYTLTFQGCQLAATTGAFVLLQGDLLAYDCTAVTGALSASYWSEILFFSAAFGGSNNAAIAGAGKMGQIAHTLNPNWLAGSSTSGTPIAVGGTGNISVASENAGGGNLNTQQNGIYTTS